MIGAGLLVVLLVDLGVDHARSLLEVEPARGFGGCDGASHYGGLGGLGGDLDVVLLVDLDVDHAGRLQVEDQDDWCWS